MFRRPPRILLDGEANPLRRHLGAAAEDAGDAGSSERSNLPFPALRQQRFRELRRGEHALDVVPGRRIVIAWSMQCSWYALRCSIQPFLMSLMTQRGSRSTQKQMPPRYWHRCSTASRRRRGPEGPSISQLAPLGKILVGQRVAEHLVVDASGRRRRRGSWECRWCRRSRRRKIGLSASALGTQRRTGPPRSHSSSKQAELLEVVEALALLERIELEFASPFRARTGSRSTVEVPLDGFINMAIEPIAGGFCKLSNIVGHGKNGSGGRSRRRMKNSFR